MKNLILLKNNLIEIPSKGKSKTSTQFMGTMLSNFVHYGYIPNKSAVEALTKCGDDSVKEFWTALEPALKKITGADKKMDKYVVYKNFPQEVLDKSQAEYWFAQILMYWGLPNEYFTQSEVERDRMFEKIELKVLSLADKKSLAKILSSLLSSSVRWTDEQFSFVEYLIKKEKVTFDIKKISFKENLVKLISAIMDSGIKVSLSSATDVLRLAIGLSDGDVSMRTNSKFRNFKRKERKFFLEMLENSSSLEEDIARDKNRWNKFLRNLHPHDYKLDYPTVSKAFSKLYNGNVSSWNSKVESYLSAKNPKVLALLEERPGEFVRRLHVVVNMFKGKAVTSFVNVVDNLSVLQLLKLKMYLKTISERETLTFAPRGNWNKLQIVENKKKMSDNYRNSLIKAIDKALASKLSNKLNSSVVLDESTKMIKLQTNDSDLSPYGRGTVFPIPDNINFIRTASYWKHMRFGMNTWFDNGWNFFDENWKSVGVCCWTDTNFNGAAVFSGDPTNSKEMEGKACQMIDLYIDKLVKSGVRYAVWNILCWSRVPFNKAEDVFAALQWGEDAQKGKLFEPSRCQLAFPVKGESMTKYIAYIDLVERKLVYVDANLRGTVHTARDNSSILETSMPAYVEYLNTLPSVFDLFEKARRAKSKGLVVSYDDKEYDISDNSLAYIFKPMNEENKFQQFDINELLK